MAFEKCGQIQPSCAIVLGFRAAMRALFSKILYAACLPDKVAPSIESM